eukprot:113283_1
MRTALDSGNSSRASQSMQLLQRFATMQSPSIAFQPAVAVAPQQVNEGMTPADMAARINAVRAQLGVNAGPTAASGAVQQVNEGGMSAHLNAARGDIAARLSVTRT